jgi:hypothetical protein
MMDLHLSQVDNYYYFIKNKYEKSVHNRPYDKINDVIESYKIIFKYENHCNYIIDYLENIKKDIKKDIKKNKSNIIQEKILNLDNFREELESEIKFQIDDYLSWKYEDTDFDDKYNNNNQNDIYNDLVQDQDHSEDEFIDED